MSNKHRNSPLFYSENRDSDIQLHLDKIHSHNSTLVKINQIVDWNIFLPIVQSCRPQYNPDEGGRPRFNDVLMLKILVLKGLYNLSDEQAEIQIRDRLSFREFLNLKLSDKVPDEKTIWLFADTLAKEDAGKHFFEMFLDYIQRQGIKLTSGKIIDSSFVEVPVQRNSRDENAQIKRGETPQRFTDNPNVGRQKDVDARWGAKGDKQFFGYKTHDIVDAETCIITDYVVTDASVYDGNAAIDLIPQEPAVKDEAFYGDSAFLGSERNPIQEVLVERGFTPMICERPYRNKELSFGQRKLNQVKSRVRCRVEHVFGWQKSRMGNEVLRSIGGVKAEFWIGIRNWCNNICRSVKLLDVD